MAVRKPLISPASLTLLLCMKKGSGILDFSARPNTEWIDDIFVPLNEKGQELQVLVHYEPVVSNLTPDFSSAAISPTHSHEIHPQTIAAYVGKKIEEQVADLKTKVAQKVIHAALDYTHSGALAYVQVLLLTDIL